MIRSIARQIPELFRHPTSTVALQLSLRNVCTLQQMPKCQLLNFVGARKCIHPSNTPQFWKRNLYVSSKLYKKDNSDEEKLTLGKKFKKMLKNYWYVLVPVHVATSVVWFGGFYVLCKSGVDVGAIMQSCGVSEAYVEKVSKSEMGYFALAYACYKIATPARYTVTIGGTTMSVKYLTNMGYLKTSNEVAQQIKDKADNIKQDVKDKADNIKQDVRGKKEEWKDKRDELRERHEKTRDEWIEAWQKFASKKK